MWRELSSSDRGERCEDVGVAWLDGRQSDLCNFYMRLQYLLSLKIRPKSDFGV